MTEGCGRLRKPLAAFTMKWAAKVNELFMFCSQQGQAEPCKSAVHVESHLRCANWRLMTCKALWDEFRQQRNVETSTELLSQLADEHARCLLHLLHDFWSACGVPGPEENVGNLLKPLRETVMEVAALKFESQVKDGRYDYSIAIIDFAKKVLDTGTMADFTEVCCRSPAFVRFSAEDDSKMMRHREVIKRAEGHTARDATWVPAGAKLDLRRLPNVRDEPAEGDLLGLGT